MARISNAREMRAYIAMKIGSEAESPLIDVLWRTPEMATARDEYLDIVGGGKSNEEIEEELAVALGVARRLLRFAKDAHAVLGGAEAPRHRGEPSNGQKARPEMAFSPRTQSERRFSAARSARMATVAAQRDDVRAYRQEILAGSLIRDDQVAALLTSPALRYLTMPECAEQGIAIPGQMAATELAAPRWDGRHYAVTLAINQRVEPLTIERDESVHPRSYTPAIGGPGTFLMWPDTVVDRLWALGQRLEDHYGWTEEGAMRFVLTGDTPPLLVRVSVIDSFDTPSDLAKMVDEDEDAVADMVASLASTGSRKSVLG